MGAWVGARVGSTVGDVGRKVGVDCMAHRHIHIHLLVIQLIPTGFINHGDVYGVASTSAKYHARRKLRNGVSFSVP